MRRLRAHGSPLSQCVQDDGEVINQADLFNPLAHRLPREASPVAAVPVAAPVPGPPPHGAPGTGSDGRLTAAPAEDSKEDFAALLLGLDDNFFDDCE